MVKKIKKADTQEAEAYWKILRWFFSYPNAISLSDLSQVLEISKKTANKFVMLLVNEGFLRKEVLGKIWRISCSPNHIYNASRKIGYNLTLVYESKYIRKRIWDLAPNSKAIVLFGSYRKGDDTEKSDVDIAVEVAGKEELRIVDFVAPKLGYRKNVHVQVHIFSRDKIDLNLFANIANGIVLEGFLEVRP